MNRANVEVVCMRSEDKVKDKRNGGEFLSCVQVGVGDPWSTQKCIPKRPDKSELLDQIISIGRPEGQEEDL